MSWFYCLTTIRYISSPKISGFIDLKEATLGLAMVSLAYLCQDHHDPELPAQKLAENALSGCYTIHEFAIAHWLELVEQCLAVPKRSNPPAKIVSLLEMLLDDRSNNRYEAEQESFSSAMFQPLQEQWPEIHELLAASASFQHVCSTSQHKKQEGSSKTTHCQKYSSV
jgi:hypothetical protein